LSRPDVNYFQEAVDATLAWTRGEGPPWLVLCGSEGVGKSYLAEAAVRALVEQGKHARIENVPELILRLLVMTENTEEAERLLVQVATTDWLALDDLGREIRTDWARDRLELLINQRVITKRRTLLATSDTKPEMAKRLGHAIADRVFGANSDYVRVCVFSGSSWRTGA
jgi:DNA replication protein DnaC